MRLQSYTTRVRLRLSPLWLRRLGRSFTNKHFYASLVLIGIGCSVVLMVMDRRQSMATQYLRQQIDQQAARVLIAFAPLKTFLLQLRQRLIETPASIEELHHHIHQLNHYVTWAKQLQQENNELRALLGLSPGPDYTATTVQILNYDADILSTQCLINRGHDQGIVKGQAVLCAQGLFGRIIETYAHSARVMLLFDSASRIPVVTTQSNVQGIVVGGHGQHLRLVFRDRTEPLIAGEEVVSASHGQVFPPGLLIGHIKDVQEGLIEPHLRRPHLHFVTVLQLKSSAP